MPDQLTPDEPPRGIPLPGGGLATTLAEALTSSMEQLYSTRRGRVPDAEKERDWMIWVTGAEAGMRLIYEMCRGRDDAEQGVAMRSLYDELRELATRKNNVMMQRAAVAQERQQRRNGGYNS